MIRSFYLSLLGLCLVALSPSAAFSQCEGCPEAQGVDYCFTSPKLPGRCAQFRLNQKTFQYTASARDKKGMEIIVPDTIDMAAMLALTRTNRKLKTEDVLFVQEALTRWHSAKIDLGYEYTESGLGYKVLREGSGARPKRGDRVTVHYRGKLKDGSVFDSSFERGQPFTANIGVGQLIRGWDEGIPMFREGARVMLRIPPELGYGSRGAGTIPANSVLYFEIEIVGVAASTN
jgi:FKBP-type peptidyl-prolyl cis-trans isomerase